MPVAQSLIFEGYRLELPNGQPWQGNQVIALSSKAFNVGKLLAQALDSRSVALAHSHPGLDPLFHRPLGQDIGQGRAGQWPAQGGLQRRMLRNGPYQASYPGLSNQLIGYQDLQQFFTF